MNSAQKLLTVISLFCIAIQAHAQNHHLTLLGQKAYPGKELSSLWGYEAPNGTPYAIVGTTTNVSIVSLIDPTAPQEVATVPGPTTTWREMKVWGHYAYVSLDNVSIGMQIIDLQYLPDSVKSVNWTAGGTISQVHTVSMDENGIMYVNGSNRNNGATLMFDVKQNPMNPTYLGVAGTKYVHDSYARGDTLWNANISDGHFEVYDVKDKANPKFLAMQQTPNKFTHNIWPNDANTHVFTTDETSGSYVAAYDITDLSEITETERWQGVWAADGSGIPHNVHVLNDYIVTAHYADGVVVIDGHDPENLVEVGRYDSHLQNETGFVGVWGVYPYFKNKNWILASDMQNGLIVLSADYQRAAYLEGVITNSADGSKINTANIELSGATGVVARKKSKPTGAYAMGTANSAQYEVLVTKPGFFPKTLNVTLLQGQTVVLNVALDPKPTISITGSVRDAATNLPISGAKIVIKNAEFDLNTTSDTSGNYTFAGFVPDNYDYFIGAWGYKTIGATNKAIGTASNPLNFVLDKGYEDPFAVDLGWKVTNTSIGGVWEWGVPVAVPAPAPGIPDLQPGYETADLGNTCYVTGNITALPNGLVFGGTTILESPLMDLTAYANPKMSFASFYLAVTQDGQPVATKMRFKLIKGAETKTILERTFSFNTPLDWKYDSIQVKDFLTPGANMKLRVEVGLAGNFSQFFEGLLDDFKVTDGVTPTSQPTALEVQVSVSPNPSATGFQIQYQLPVEQFETAQIQIINALGQVVSETITEAPQGDWLAGNELQAGVYFVTVRIGEQVWNVARMLKL
jgi:choice-of-anchor B domain-containing protein